MVGKSISLDSRDEGLGEVEGLEASFDARHSRLVDGRLVHHFFHHVVPALPEAALSRAVYDGGPSADPMDDIRSVRRSGGPQSTEGLELEELAETGLSSFLDLFVVSVGPGDGRTWKVRGLLRTADVKSVEDLLQFAAEEAIGCWFGAEQQVYGHLISQEAVERFDRLRSVFGWAVMIEHRRRQAKLQKPIIDGEPEDARSLISAVDQGAFPPFASELFKCWFPRAGRTMTVFNSPLDGKENLTDIGAIWAESLKAKVKG